MGLIKVAHVEGKQNPSDIFTKEDKDTEHFKKLRNSLLCDVDEQESTDANIEILRRRMIAAYSKAGSMMLVSSVTTAICFFSNAFGVLTVIQEFGIFMG